MMGRVFTVAAAFRFLIIFAVLPKLQSQNLVYNGGFEVFKGEIPCGWVARINEFNINNWTLPTYTTADIYSSFQNEQCPNYCGSGSNIVGISAHRGQSMVGIFTYGVSPPHGAWREYIQTHLSAPLVPGELYVLKAWVRLHKNSPFAAGNLGFYFSKQPVKQDSYKRLNLTPQIEFAEILDRADRWVLIQDTLLAREPFQYMTIGNFRDDRETPKIDRGTTGTNILDLLYNTRQRAYYLLDDISLEPLNPALKVELQNRTEDLDLMTQVHFEHDHFDLAPDMEARLKKLLLHLNQKPQLRVMLGGHTDSVGATDYNMNLSEMRALEVKNYLIRNGLHPGRILTQWFGPHRPAADNNSPDGRYLNRRVVIELIY
jgi:outer membrane protein OmpA-like peptidoglycan-associated protein